MADNILLRPSALFCDRPWRASIRGLCAIVLALSVAACSGDDEVPYVERPVHDLYNSAKALLDSGAYEPAAKAFDEVERQHPYSKWATKAQIMAAYAYYLDNDYDDAIIALDRFIQLNPSHRDVPYAYYLKGLSYYEQISTVDRDQAMTENALSTLNELLTRFPESTYSRDAKIKVELTYDSLAGKEMEIGRYYLFQRQYLAAINRFKRVIDEYQTTTHVPEALLRLTEAYMSLGLDAEAKKTAAVLGHNFPGSDWYAEAYTLVQGGPPPGTSTAGEAPTDEPEESWYVFW